MRPTLMRPPGNHKKEGHVDPADPRSHYHTNIATLREPHGAALPYKHCETHFTEGGLSPVSDRRDADTRHQRTTVRPAGQISEVGGLR